MKRLKTFSLALVLTFAALSISAATFDSYHKKAFDLVCYFYIGSVIIPINGPGIPMETEFKNCSNWSLTGSILNCEGSTYVCAICYDPTGETYSNSFCISVLNTAWNARSSWECGVTIAGTDGSDADTDGIRIYCKDF